MEYIILSILFTVSVLYVIKHVSSTLIPSKSDKCFKCDIKNSIQK
tara:strand:+ start:253 stop:387 length:135 start_codon:yes stop_codon:yes gene_type:complete